MCRYHMVESHSLNWPLVTFSRVANPSFLHCQALYRNVRMSCMLLLRGAESPSCQNVQYIRTYYRTVLHSHTRTSTVLYCRSCTKILRSTVDHLWNCVLRRCSFCVILLFSENASIKSQKIIIASSFSICFTIQGFKPWDFFFCYQDFIVWFFPALVHCL